MNNIRADQIKKMEILDENNIDSYPSEVFRTHEIRQFVDNFSKLKLSRERVILCGRIMSIRNQGGIIFIDFFDGTEKVQAVFTKNVENANSFDLFVATVTLSDFIEFSGGAYTTKRGVNSLNIESWRMLAKSLRQVPNQWNGIKEKERYRKRYLDILLNPNVHDLLRKRSIFWNSIRSFMLKRGFIEVETPILETSPIGSKVRQFISHHNSLDTEVYLRVSPELWHKKLIIGGIPKIFEIGRVFRNEGMSYEHAQDYTAFEFYESYKGAKEGIPMFIELFRYVAQETFGTLKFKVRGFEIDLEKEWEILNFNQLIQEKYGFDPRDTTINKIKTRLDKAGILYGSDINKNLAIDIVWKQIQKTLGGPSIVTKIPYSFAPLGKRSRNEKDLVDEFKIMIGGSELGHGFNELNDPIDQRQRFIEQQGLEGDVNNQDLIDYEYIEALEYGMPPTFGLGLSERLFSFLLDIPIREAQAFPIMKPIKSKAKIE
jgi:lysyl-tRNA synthetase, class II